jgi:histidinol-phosphate aminotransferase
VFKENLTDLRAYDPGPPIAEIMRSYGLTKIVKLDSNENVYGASPKVAEAIAGAALLPHLYPDCRDLDLRSDLSRRLGVRQNQFLFGTGLDEIIVLISRAFLNPAASIVMAWPTFYEYYCHARIEGAEVRRVPLAENGGHDLDAMQAAIDETTRIVWICNPNNPTGTYVDERSLTAFIAKVPSDVLIVLDEAYIDFVTAGDFPHSLNLIKQHPNVLVLRTFSKSYGLASFRIGYAIGTPRVINEIDKVRPPFNNPRLSQIAALAALQDQPFMQSCVRRNGEVRRMTTDFLNRRGISYYPTQANFIFIRTDRAQALQEQCRRRGFLISAFDGGIRVTLGKADDMRKLLAILESALVDLATEQEM